MGHHDGTDHRKPPVAKLPKRARGQDGARRVEVIVRRRPAGDAGASMGEMPEFGVPDFYRGPRS